MPTDSIHIRGDSDRSVIFVHECGFKPSSAECLDTLVAALAAGVESDNVESLDLFASLNKYLAFYGDVSSEFLIAQDQFYDEKLDLGDLSNALHQLKAVDRKKGFSVAKYDKLPGKSSVREFAASVLGPVLSAVGLEKKLISSSSTDLGEYWRKDSELSAAVLQRVRSTIQDALNRNERIMLIAHGSGSIVAYDALWQISHDPEHAESYAESKIDVFLTIGSPLGDTTVRQQLRGSDRKGRERFPSNVLAWHNVSAEDDYISHDNTVGDDFSGMLKQRQISSIRDYHVYNMAIRYGQANPHSAIGYLIHPRVTRILVDWLAQSFGNPLPKGIL